MMTTGNPNSLDPGTIYGTLDDAMRAASCFAGNPGGATVYGTIVDRTEYYVVVVEGLTQRGGARWAVPTDGHDWTPLYTITRPHQAVRLRPQVITRLMF